MAVPLIFQMTETECGVAALAMVLAYFGTHVPLECLRDSCGSSRDGTNATTLIEVAKSYGYEAAAYRVELADLRVAEMPVIAYWRFSHYVVITKITASYVYINDPGLGRLRVTHEQFNRDFTGVIIAIAPTTRAVAIPKRHRTLSSIYKISTSYHLEILFGFFCIFVTTILTLFLGGMSGVIVNQSQSVNLSACVPAIAACIFIAMIAYTGSFVYQKRHQFSLCARASVRKSAEVMQHALQMSYIYYALRSKSEIFVIISRAEEMVKKLFDGLTATMVRLTAVIIALIVLLKTSLLLSSIMLILTGIYFLVMIVIDRYQADKEAQNVAVVGRHLGQSLSVIKNIETIKASGLEAYVLVGIRAMIAAKLSVHNQSARLGLVAALINKIYNQLLLLCLFGVGAILIANGVLNLGSLLAFYTLQLIFINNLAGIFEAIKGMHTAAILSERVEGMKIFPLDNRFLGKNSESEPASDLIQLQNVCFYYNKSIQPTLDNVCIDIYPGQQVAFVGDTGSGKSTLLKLIAGLLQPSAGCYRSSERIILQCAYVAQEVGLFSGTLYHNLTLWRDDIDIQLIKDALRIACLDAVVRARGLYASVDENGRNFSGGERQRIEVARALIQDKPILLLDEATSALDAATESAVISNLRRLDKTTIYVAHRLQAIMHCDHIFVMARGRVQASGNHAYLYDHCLLYRELFDAEYRREVA